MPNATKGSDIKWLMWYLAGPGRYNEHTNQRVLAGDVVTMAVYAGAIDQPQAWELGKLLDSPRQTLMRGEPVSVTHYKKAKALMADGMSRKEALEAATSDENTWHCSLALKPSEGQLSDEKWRLLADDFMREMGFVGRDDGVPDVRWAAVHHGLNRNDCDHIHIAMSVVRPDGSLADMMYDQPRSQRAVGVIERRHGLQVLASRETGETERATTPAERAHMQRVGAPETDREALRRRVRGAAMTAGSEVEWLRELADQQVVVRPRFAKDSTTEVTGYSVRLAAQKNTKTGKWETPRGYSGLQLGKDLTLPSMRSWADWDTSDSAQQDAVAEWQRLLASSQRARNGSDRNPRAPLDPAAQHQAIALVARWSEQIRAIPVEDVAAFRRAASQTSGLFAAASVSTEPTPGPLDRMARQLARIGDTDPTLRWRPKQHRPATDELRAVSRMLWLTTSPQAAQLALMEAVMECAMAIADARDAAAAARVESQLAAQARQALTEIHMRADGIDPNRPYETTPGSPAWSAAYRASAVLAGEDRATIEETVRAQRIRMATSPTRREGRKAMAAHRPKPWQSLDEERAETTAAAAALRRLQRRPNVDRGPASEPTATPGRPPAPHRGHDRGGYER